MIKIATYSDKMSADLMAQALKGNQIEAVVVGAKEYASFITGSDAGVYNLMVTKEQMTEAEAIVRRLIPLEKEEENTPAINPNIYLKKSIMYSVMACILIPIVFNYASLRNLYFYLKTETVFLKKCFYTILILALQIPVIYSLYFLFHLFNEV